LGARGAALQGETAMNASLIKNKAPQLALIGAVIVTFAIAYLSLLPGEELPAQSLNDKMNHFIAYGVLSFLAVLGRHKTSLIMVIGLAIGYGALLEGAQGCVGKHWRRNAWSTRRHYIW